MAWVVAGSAAMLYARPSGLMSGRTTTSVRSTIVLISWAENILAPYARPAFVVYPSSRSAARFTRMSGPPHSRAWAPLTNTSAGRQSKLGLPRIRRAWLSRCSYVLFGNLKSWVRVGYVAFNAMRADSISVTLRNVTTHLRVDRSTWAWPARLAVLLCRRS